MSGRTFVLGGGVAGIAAALGLRARGHAVTLLESHGWLGGRAFSSADRQSGRMLDNGPHVMLGCYRAMRRLLRELGTEGEFEQGRALAIAYRTAEGRAASLQLSRWPVPLAMPAALLRLPWRPAQKVQALRGFAAALLGAPPAWTLADWLRRRGQLGAPTDWLWQPLCRAIMNVEPHEASAAGFLATVREAFGGSAAAGAFWIPRRPWGAIVGSAASRVLPARGVEVRCSTRVRGFDRRGERIAAIALADGDRIELGPDDQVVSALPWHALAPLLPATSAFAAIGAAPLVTAYVAFAADGEAPPDEGPLTALVAGAPFHFLYRSPGARRGELALLAGGCRMLDGVGVDEIAQAARRQLAQHYPECAAAAAAAQVQIRKEARATIVAAPGSDALRPFPGRLAAGPSNLLVCGDWTGIRLPSTLEGAARSAEALLPSVPPPR